MSQKVKCNNCKHFMGVLLPVNVGENNYKYAKCCLRDAMKYGYCEQINRGKKKTDEKYCEFFTRNNNDCKRKHYENELKELQKKIIEYEKSIKNR